MKWLGIAFVASVAYNVVRYLLWPEQIGAPRRPYG